MTRLHKRILVFLLIFLCIVCLALFFLVKNANEILKSELEKYLGKDFYVKRIVLNLDSVDAYDIRLLKDGEEVARSEKMSIRADFLSFLKRHYSVSSVILEKPYLKVVIDKQGALMIPFIEGIRKTEGSKESTKSNAFEIGRITVNNGQVLFQDERLPEAQNTIALKEVNIVFEGLMYPFENLLSSVKLSAVTEGKIISGRAGTEGKINLKTGSLDMHVDGQNLVLLDLDKQGPIFSAESMTLSVASKEDRNGQYYFFDNVVLKRPYLRYETDGDGELVSPWKEVMEELKKALNADPTSHPVK